MIPSRFKTQRDSPHSASCSGSPLPWFAFQALLITSSNSLSVRGHCKLEQPFEGSDLQLSLAETWAYKTGKGYMESNGLQFTSPCRRTFIKTCKTIFMFCLVLASNVSDGEYQPVWGTILQKKQENEGVGKMTC